MDNFVTMAQTLLVAINLVYLILVILVYLLLVPLVIFFALPLVVIGAFVVLAVTGHTPDLSALIVLLMLRGIVVTNAIVLLALVSRPRHSAAKNASEKKRSWTGCCRLMGVRRAPQAKDLLLSRAKGNEWL
jgi:multidrug efflux pump subunit AcrB